MKPFKYSEVLKEIKHLQENATQKEKDKLNIEDLDTTYSFNCIYGLMTGDCSSRRAEDLYRKSLLEIPTKKYPNQERGEVFTHLEVYIYNNDEGAELALNAIKYNLYI
jgi:predicted metal-dependent peptidase